MARVVLFVFPDISRNLCLAMRLLIVGEAPSQTTGAALTGRSGARLAALLGLARSEFPAHPRVNLLEEWPVGTSTFPVLPAVLRAAELREQGWDTYLLVGRRVAGAFGFRPDVEYLRWYSLGGKRYAVLPHPTAVRAWWRDVSNRAAARAFMARLNHDTREKVPA